MHRFDWDKHKGDRWRVLGGTDRSQAAAMVIPAGDKEGGPDNKHGGDQWLYVVSGRGHATVEGRTVELAEGTLICIEAGERHEIRAESELATLNFYAPPQY